MSVIRYLVLANKTEDGRTKNAVATARAISHHPSMLFAWNGNADENRGMVEREFWLIPLTGSLSVLFDGSAGRDILDLLRSGIGRKATLVIEAMIFDEAGRQFQRPEPRVFSVEVSSVVPSENGTVLNFKAVSTEPRFREPPSLPMPMPPVEGPVSKYVRPSWWKPGMENPWRKN
jgi:hypothetical protein